MTNDDEVSFTRLTGRPLIVARGVWIVVVTLAIVLYFLSIPWQLVDSGNQPGSAGLEQLRQAGLAPGFYAGYLAVLTGVFVLVFWIVAGVIFWRKSNDWMALFISLALVLVAVNNNSVIAPLGTAYPALQFLIQAVAILGQVSFNLAFYLFPDGRFAPRWIRWLLPLLIAYAALAVFRPDLLGNSALALVLPASALFAQIYRYARVSNAAQRQQTKWVVLGTVLAAAGIMGVIIYGGIAWPDNQNPPVFSELIIGTIWNFFLALIPLSVGVAILRSHLWDIDILIRRTLIYGALTALLALAYFGTVLVLEGLVRLLTGQSQSQVVTVISTLAIAALFVPLRGWLQRAIDHRFYRRKYDAARTLAKFGASLRDEVNLDDLSAHLLSAVDETMQPETAALWLRPTHGSGQTK